MVKYTSVSIANISACITPTKTSKNINGMGSKKANIAAMEASNTSPAKIFPNSLNDRDATLATSPIISISPTNTFIGFTKTIVGSLVTFLGISISAFRFTNLFNFFLQNYVDCPASLQTDL